jgi:hypothetical protein
MHRRLASPRPAPAPGAGDLDESRTTSPHRANIISAAKAMQPTGRTDGSARHGIAAASTDDNLVPIGSLGGDLRVGKAMISERFAVAAVLVLVAAMVGAIGCGATKRGRSAQPPSRTPKTFETPLYFLTQDAGAPLGALRTLLARSSRAREASSRSSPGRTRTSVTAD